MMKRLARTFVAALVCLVACSGGDGGAPGPAQPAPAPEGQGAPPNPEVKLRAAQESAIEAMCERLTDCAVEEARASLSPEEFAKLDVENTAPALRDECEEAGAKRGLSPRQVRVVQRCVSEPSSCEALQTCLEQAKKQSPASSASP